jgi:hypothetical protein
MHIITIVIRIGNPEFKLSESLTHRTFTISPYRILPAQPKYSSIPTTYPEVIPAPNSEIFL